MSNDHPDIHDYLQWLERSPEVFKHALDAIAVYDLEGCVVSGNASARTLIGQQFAAMLVGRHFTDGHLS